MRKIVNYILSALFLTVLGLIISRSNKKYKKSNSGDLNNKFKEYYNILNQWLYLKNSGRCLEQILLSNNIKNIAVYGMGEIGTRLIEDLENSSILVKYGIDNNAQKANTQIEILNSDERWPLVDAIVVTATFDMDNIKKTIRERCDYKIISIKDIVFDNL